MEVINETGGIKIGWIRASWPLAKLTVTKDKLELNGGLIGNLVFRPSDVISIEAGGFFAFTGRGLKIIHNVANYYSTAIFITSRPNALIAQIKEIGFLENKGPLSFDLENEISMYQSTGSFPMKIPMAIAMVVIWNVLFLLDQTKLFHANRSFGIPGAGAQIALAFVFLTFLSLLISQRAREIILRPGRKVSDISTTTYFFMLITGIMFLGFSLIPK